MPRLFDFVGSDQEYIEYLESKFQALESSPDHHSAPSQQQVNDFRFVECRPQAAKARQLPEKRSATEWEKQLEAFISSIPGRHEWQKARKDAGIDTVQRNRQAMCLMLGQQTAAIFVSAEGSIMLPRMHPCDNQNLVLKGCMYGEFICRCDNDKSFAVRVAAYQKLIFLSYCTVLLRIGMSRDTVYSMMGMYSDSKKTSTLDYYCSGALWVNRCMSTLLKNGWGYKSWEIFLLEPRSAAMFGRIAANNKKSYSTVVDQLGTASVPIQEDGWMPYCVPGIVKYLAGDYVELDMICHILGYEPQQVPIIQAVFKSFSEFGPSETNGTSNHNRPM